MKRILRVGVLAASLAGLVVTVAPTPAEATTAGEIAFTGVATVGPHGIAYPLVDNSQAPSPTNPTLHLDTHKTPPNMHNSAVIEAFNSITCVGEVVGTKSTPTKAVPDVCSISGATALNTGVVHGYCGLSDGRVHVVVQSGSFSYRVSVSFAAVGGQLVITGHWHKHGTTHSGPLVGTANATPDAAGAGGAGTGSCLGKQRKTFLVVGEATFGAVTSGSSIPHVSLPRTSTPSVVVPDPTPQHISAHTSAHVSTGMGTSVSGHISAHFSDPTSVR